MEDTFLTTDEVLKYLQVNLRTIYRLIKAGKLPAVRVGRQWRFRTKDLDAWLESQRHASAHPDTPVTAPRRPSAAPSNRPRILVVEDDDSVRTLLAKALDLADYEVHVAPDGHIGLERLAQYSYDLLIADLNLPGLDGLSMARQARRSTPALPVIIITGHSTERTAIDAANLGVAGYLTKPLRIPRVLATVAHALGEEEDKK
jgi:excisionase family DNA binding protein